jgi:hypothetical protein
MLIIICQTRKIRFYAVCEIRCSSIRKRHCCLKLDKRFGFAHVFVNELGLFSFSFGNSRLNCRLRCLPTAFFAPLYLRPTSI